MAPVARVGVTENGEKANRALYAAGLQGKAWLFAEILYRNQGTEGSDWMDDDMVARGAEAAGLDMARFEADRATDAAERVTADAWAEMQADGVDGTPGFLVRSAAGDRQTQVPAENATPTGFDQAVAAIRAGQWERSPPGPCGRFPPGRSPHRPDPVVQYRSRRAPPDDDRRGSHAVHRSPTEDPT